MLWICIGLSREYHCTGCLLYTSSEDNYEKASREKRLVNNVIHASDAKESAERELQIWQNYL